MESSILKSTKKVLGLSADYTAFDPDIIMHINAAFVILNQIGVGPTTGFMIEDDEAEWDSYGLTDTAYLNLVKTYVYLKVRLLFDPPGTSFLLTSMEKQIDEYAWRLEVYGSST